MADVLWRDCANWLIRCQALPPDHRVTWANAQLIDLANTLRDGVLLCQLLNKLQPGCVDLKEMSLRPQMSQVSCESAHLDPSVHVSRGPWLVPPLPPYVRACARAFPRPPFSHCSTGAVSGAPLLLLFVPRPSCSVAFAIALICRSRNLAHFP